MITFSGKQLELLRDILFDASFEPNRTNEEFYAIKEMHEKLNRVVEEAKSDPQWPHVDSFYLVQNP